ncbi:GGDEF domain-containing protein [Marinobacter bohaiensis]|uniref:GGDEF domain-containing protein n=1 Tax=Marinobacter bohaiensis TaxID=2201898 RepID=UPI000DABDB4F|nr:GGDEF domain-containing protein [Marinobacter bohaiensis]
MPPHSQSGAVPAVADDEARQSARIVIGLSLGALLSLALVGLASWQAGQRVHAEVLGLFFLLVSINLLVYRLTIRLEWMKTGLLGIAGGLFAYLIASGGESGTGPLWLYVLPPVIFYLTSLRAGTVMLTVMLIFTLVVFRFPQLPFVLTHYGTDFQLRFITTLLFESVCCFFMESSRRKARAEWMRLAEAHEQAAHTDSLTGLPNRRDMQRQLAEEFARYRRSGRHFSVCLIDLDLFKQINDDYGHDAGDTVLLAFAGLMERVCRESDRLCRWGGEEFLVLLPDTSLLQALSLAERLRDTVEHHTFRDHDRTLPVTLSAGVCSISQFDSIDALLRQADKQLYDAKSAGRNRIAPPVRRQGKRSPGA